MPDQSKPSTCAGFDRQTLLFLTRGGGPVGPPWDVLLCEKKRGWCRGVINGVGGHLEPGETSTECIVRETREEVGIELSEAALVVVAALTFHWVQVVRKPVAMTAYTAWMPEGQEVVETDEVRPFWVPVVELPSLYGKMWNDDPYWVDHVLVRGMRAEGEFEFDEDYRITRAQLVFETRRG